MQIHGSCAARDGAGVLLFGGPGSGKSDLLLRLLDHGFQLVADDRVVVVGRRARAPDALAGLIEVRGIGIVRLPFLAETGLVLAVQLEQPDRLPAPAAYLGLPMVRVEASHASAPARVRLALDCALGHVTSVAGAFA